MKNNYVNRALAAQVGIYGNSKEEALYTMYEKAPDGHAYDGEKQNTIHFAHGTATCLRILLGHYVQLAASTSSC